MGQAESSERVSKTPTQAPPAPPLQPPLHQSDADEDDENVKQLEECSSVYLSLEDCLVNSDRNWKACQKEVQALKVCSERKKKNNNQERE